LEAIELLGAALTVQLLTIVFGALPRFCFRRREILDDESIVDVLVVDPIVAIKRAIV
jgi:hypothetical protein